MKFLFRHGNTWSLDFEGSQLWFENEKLLFKQFFKISQLKEVLGPKYVKNISSRFLKNIQTETT